MVRWKRLFIQKILDKLERRIAQNNKVSSINRAEALERLRGILPKGKKKVRLRELKSTVKRGKSQFEELDKLISESTKIFESKQAKARQVKEFRDHLSEIRESVKIREDLIKKSLDRINKLEKLEKTRNVKLKLNLERQRLGKLVTDSKSLKSEIKSLMGRNKEFLTKKEFRRLIKSKGQSVSGGIDRILDSIRRKNIQFRTNIATGETIIVEKKGLGTKQVTASRGLKLELEQPKKKPVPPEKKPVREKPKPKKDKPKDKDDAKPIVEARQQSQGTQITVLVEPEVETDNTGPPEQPQKSPTAPPKPKKPAVLDLDEPKQKDKLKIKDPIVRAVQRGGLIIIQEDEVNPESGQKTRTKIKLDLKPGQINRQNQKKIIDTVTDIVTKGKTDQPPETIPFLIVPPTTETIPFLIVPPTTEEIIIQESILEKTSRTPGRQLPGDPFRRLPPITPALKSKLIKKHKELLKKKKKKKFVFQYTPTLDGVGLVKGKPQKIYTGFEVRGSKVVLNKPITVKRHKRGNLKHKMFVRKHGRRAAKFKGFSARRKKK